MDELGGSLEGRDEDGGASEAREGVELEEGEDA